MSLARATISGIVASEPEKRFTPNNIAVANFTVQVTPGSKNDAPYTVNITCWRELADKVVETLHRDDEVVVEGRLQVHQYESNGGITRRTYEIDANAVYLGRLTPLTPFAGGQSREYGGSSPASGGYGAQAPQSATQASAQPAISGVAPALGESQQTGFFQDELLTEDDIPF